MTTTYDVTLDAGVVHQFHLPDGRKLHVYVIPPEHLKDHACVDIWTTRGREVEDISAHTGDKTRAPMGLIAWNNGGRPVTNCDTTPESHGWPAVSSVSLLWDLDQ